MLNEEVPYVRYLIGWIAKKFYYINDVLNASAYGLRGYVDILSPLVAMHLLERSCVIVGIFLKYSVPQQHRCGGGWCMQAKQDSVALSQKYHDE